MLAPEAANRTPRTLEAHREALARFVARPAATGALVDAAALRPDCVQEFLSGLRAGRKPATVAIRYLAPGRG